ncbi:MAG TPA: hypothetical protein VF905_01790, partial [Nitrospirota bacterium]
LVPAMCYLSKIIGRASGNLQRVLLQGSDKRRGVIGGKHRRKIKFKVQSPKRKAAKVVRFTMNWKPGSSGIMNDFPIKEIIDPASHLERG